MSREFKFATLFLLFAIYSAAQNRVVDSLLSILKSTSDKITRIQIYDELIWQYIQEGQFAIGLKYADSTLVYVQQVKPGSVDKENLIQSYKSRIINSKGTIFARQGNYPEALNNFFAALRIREKLQDVPAISSSRNNIAGIYLEQKNYNEALENFKIALRLSENAGDEAGKVNAINNIGIVYSYLGEQEKALENFKTVLEIYEQHGDEFSKAGALINIASIYLNQGKYNIALKHQFSAFEICEKTENRSGMAVVSNNIATTLLNQKKISEAADWYKKSLQLSLETRSNDDIQSNYYGLAKTDSAKGDYKSCLKHLTLAHAYRDSIINEKNTRKSIEIQMQYDFDKKVTADSIKNAGVRIFENIKYQQEINKQRLFTFGGTIGLLLMLLIAALSYSAFRTKKKANLKIAEQKAIVEEKQKEILDSIYYARRIQRSLLTPERYIKRSLEKLNNSR